MRPAEQINKITPDDYLQGELKSDVRHEFVGGYVYAMVGAGFNHAVITANLSRAIGNKLNHSDCLTFIADMKLKIDENFFYPDIIVDCDFDQSTPYYSEFPVLVVEVLSPSTRKTDKTTKRDHYLRIPSLQEYALIEQDCVDIEMMRRSNGWQSNHYFIDDEITFESINLTLSVEAIYDRVKNDDIATYLAKQKGAAGLKQTSN